MPPELAQRPALAGATALLASAQLPTEDLSDAHCEHSTTAETFFERRGFTRADRASAPAAIRATREFAGICPASSAFMARTL